MSFADDLRNNYQPNNTIREKEEYKSDYIIRSIVLCTKKKCKEVSKNSRLLSGFFCSDYDGDFYIGNDAPRIFIYDNISEEKKRIIKHFEGGFGKQYWSKESRDRIVENTKNELIKLGFRKVTVRAEEILTPVLVGYTEFLHRDKYEKFSSFRIFISVSW